MRHTSGSRFLGERDASGLPPLVLARLDDPRLVFFDKSRTASRIHRDGRLDCLTVQVLGDDGELRGFGRFIGMLRHRATRAIFERRDTVIVASVSCIYGLGSPEVYKELAVEVSVGLEMDRDMFLSHLVGIQYSRNDVGFGRGTFRVRGDLVEVRPVASETALRVSFFGDEVEEIAEFDPLTNKRLETYQRIMIWPAQHYVVHEDIRDRALLARALTNYAATVEMVYWGARSRSDDAEEGDMMRMANVREPLMAETMIWLARERYPDRKLIVWAASSR